MMASTTNTDPSLMDPLSIATGADTANENPEDSNDEMPLEQRILEIVKSCPKNDNQEFTTKPARLSAELGISIEDATAELCGLLAAVGGGYSGAYFTFETTKSVETDGQVSTMVFHFPADFERRAKINRRKEDFKLLCWETLYVVWKGVKILTAFGLILSLFILTVAAMIGIVAAIVAMSTNNQRGNGNQRTMLLRQLRVLFFTVRQMLWCYALYGDHAEGQDPFLGEMAYDMSLLMGICCANPGSFFWWWRVQQLNRRRRRARRGWGRGMFSQRAAGAFGRNELESDVEGVSLVRRGEWGQDQLQTSPSPPSDEQRGLLSIAVEYLFGPSPFQPGPTETEIWKLRAAALVHLLAKNAAGETGSSGVSLQQLSPYMDNPPSSLDQDVATIVAGGLEIVSHFNGIPAANNTNTNDQAQVPAHLARFHFPELASESQYATRYDGYEEEDQDESWGSLLCLDQPALVRPHRTGESTTTVPNHLVERRFKFTKLQTNQFLYCGFLGAINLIGVLWLRSSLEPPNGILQIPDGTFLATVIKNGLVRVLYFYAILFFVLPAGRLILIVVLNSRRKGRNQRRTTLASTLDTLAAN